METIKESYIERSQQFKEKFKSILENYLVRQEEEDLYQAYNLAHTAITSNINLLDLLNSYQVAIIEIIAKNPEKREIIKFLNDILKFLSEILAPYEMTLRGYKDAILQLKNNTIHLEEEQQKIKYIVNRLDAGLIVLDKTGEMLLINSTLKYYFLKFFNIDIKQNLMIQELPKCILSDAIKMCFSKFDYFTINIDLAEDFYLKAISNLISDNDQQIINSKYLIIEFRDISTFVQFDKLRTSFISMVTHELRSPISAISLSIKNLIKYSQNLSTEDRSKLENIISSNSNLMIEIVEDLLLVSQIDEKRMKLNFQWFSIDDSITEVLLQLDQKIQYKQVQINRSPNSEFSILGDKSRIQQVIRIILDNAIKYSNEKGLIEISVRKENINLLSIIIQDHGKGIKEYDLKNLFQRFYRSKDVGHIPGTGLGLAIAKDLITLHKGEIEISSKYGEGSIFKIILPINKPNEN